MNLQFVFLVVITSKMCEQELRRSLLCSLHGDVEFCFRNRAWEEMPTTRQP